ncbi:ATP synthase F1 subunit epsilon [Candidatus Dojkabacteria bacterium]|nr:ATP synthase F1 subunit epsilon [Candidatus Dojkabacteria bacterium]
MLLKIVSSSKKLFEGDVEEVYVPGSKGQMGILKNHRNMISTLDVGQVKIKNLEGEEIFILNGGFVEVKGEEVIILADEAESTRDLVQKEIGDAIKLAEEKMASELPPTELIRLEKQLRYERLKRESFEKSK